MIPVELAVVEPLGRLLARPWADAITGVQIDSRRIREGDLFVAVGSGTSRQAAVTIAVRVFASWCCEL